MPSVIGPATDPLVNAMNAAPNNIRTTPKVNRELLNLSCLMARIVGPFDYLGAFRLMSCGGAISPTRGGGLAKFGEPPRSISGSVLSSTS